MEGRGKDTSKRDIGWEHFVLFDDKQKKVKCKWCARVISGGISRGKQHLAGVKGNVAACTAVPLDIRKEFNLLIRGKNVEKQKARAREELIVDEMTIHTESSTDEDDSDSEVQRVMRESRREFEMNEQSRRRGDGSSRQRVEIGRSASMRVPEVNGRNKRLNHVGIGPSHTQPTVDNFLYSKQTSIQPKITKAVLKGIKDSKKFIGRAWTKNTMVSARKARAYYKEEFYDQDDEFVNMLFLDSCIIIRTILAFSQQTQSMSFLDVHIKEVRSDLLLLDNQIPLFFIKEVYEWFLNNLNDQILPDFITVLEPFICLDMPWRINHDAKSSEAAHLLDLYWRYSLSPQMDMKLSSSERYRSETERDLSNSSEFNLSNNNALMVIANATELQKMAGIEFEIFKDEGHLDVIFSNGIMRMPRLKIDSRQITLLRNLIAFENCIIPSMRTISCYMKLMDALIDSANDVMLLQKCSVIYNTLESHERAANFFNDIGNFCFTDDNENPFSGLYNDVQKYYDSRWHRRWATLRRNYFNSPWAGISVVAAVTLLILSALQTFYTVYGVYKRNN